MDSYLLSTAPVTAAQSASASRLQAHTTAFLSPVGRRLSPLHHHEHPWRVCLGQLEVWLCPEPCH